MKDPFHNLHWCLLVCFALIGGALLGGVWLMASMAAAAF